MKKGRFWLAVAFEFVVFTLWIGGLAGMTFGVVSPEVNVVVQLVVVSSVISRGVGYIVGHADATESYERDTQ